MVGQGAVRSAALSADLTAADGSAQVRIDYVLEGEASVADVELLGFADATAEELVVDGRSSVLRLGTVSGRRRAAELSLTAPDADGARRLSLRYEVTGAVEHDEGRVRVRIPVASVSFPPAADAPGTVFSASLRLPSGWSVTEAFPSGLTRVAESSYEVGLAVVPAVVAFRARNDGRRVPGVPAVLSGVAGVILLGLGLAGWRHLRSVAA